MAIHKYIFFFDDKGIRTYRFRNNSGYEIVRYKGENLCKEKDIKNYFQWFEKIASIAGDDGIDFCFLSKEPIESPLFEYATEKMSSWKQEDILEFCQSDIGKKNYEICIDEDKRFVCQISNIVDKNSVEKLYLKCIPEFRFEQKIGNKESMEETSILSRYFIEKLKEL